MKKDNAKSEPQTQQKSESGKKLRIKTSAHTEISDPQLPCQLMLF